MIPPAISSTATTPAIQGQRRRRRRTSEMNLSGMAGPDGIDLPSARHHQPVADVELFARQQSAVAAPPCAALDVVAQPLERALEYLRLQLAEARYARLGDGLEIALRAAPVRAEEAVAAVVRDRHALDLRLPAERLDDRRDRGQARAVDDGDLGQVIAHEPERLGLVRVEREHHNGPARDAPQLAH